MDYVVNINDGSEDTRPIVLRLLPGEETVFNLRVINHGEPSNISLETSTQVSRAVRLKKPDHYVVVEETIPILVRMPSNKDRLDGEILLTSNSGDNIVPISLLRDPDPEDDLEDPKALIDDDSSDDPEDDEDAIVVARAGADEAESDEDEEDEEDEEWERIEVDGSLKDREKESEDEEESPRIEFSRHKDVQSYRAASKSAQSLQSKTAENEIKGREPSRNYPGAYQAEYQEEYQAEYKTDNLVEVRGDPPGEYLDNQADSRYRNSDNDSNLDNSDDSYEGEMEEDGHDIHQSAVMDILGESAALQIIPAAIFLGLVFILLLTFLTGTIPEFPGALASSILIVTLIIYGAATLLKA